MNKSVMIVALLATLACGCAPRFFDPRTTSTFQLVGSSPKYWVYLPKAWTPEPSGQGWPVIVALHGSGERGSDPVKPTQHGLGPVVWRSHGEFPAIVIFPQAPEHSYWGMPDNNARVLAALDEVLAKYHGDPARVYLTGNSLGGFGTWFLGALHPERFAALVPICGGVRGKSPRPDAPFAGVPEDQRPAEIAKRIGKLPVWIFHGNRDWLVPVRYSQEMDAVLRAAGGDVHYTEYPDLGHESWDRAYADPALFTWLLAQHR